MSEKPTRFIPLSVPVLVGNEAEYVKKCLDSGWVSSAGPWVNHFEENFASFVGVAQSVSVSSGTAGIHLALLVAGVGAEEEVIVPTVTFIATVNAVRYVNACPVFMDCDEDLNIDLEKVESFLRTECDFNGASTINKKSGRTIKAIIPVHTFGHLVNIQKLSALAKAFNLKVIEDAAEALGSFWIDGKKSAGTVGDFGCFSFNGNKIITTGGGGIVVAREPSGLSKVKYLSTQAKDDEVYFVHNEVGYNYRLTSLQAAVGIAQLELLNKFVEIKRKNFQFYNSLFSKKTDQVSMYGEPKGTSSNYWLCNILLPEKVNLSDLIHSLQSQGIQTRPVWKLNHLQKPFEKFQSYQISKANELVKRTLSIPSSPNLTEEEMVTVVDSVVGSLK